MKAKKLSALMLVLMVAFILCSCQKEEKIVAYINYAEELEESRPDVYSIAAADKYLAEQGYSQEFLESAGGVTKIYLCGAGAVFEAQSELSAEVAGVSARLTVSDVPTEDENISVKIFTLNWSWSGERTEEECVSFAWDNDVYWDYNEFSALSGGSLFEIHGSGTLDMAETPLPAGGMPVLPERASGTIFRSTSISSLTDGYDDMRQFVEGSGHHPVSGDARIGYTFTVNKNWMFGKWFPQESGGEGYGVYAMDADNGRGSYSATLVRFINGEDINYGAEHVAEASYSHGNGGEPVTVRCKFND